MQELSIFDAYDDADLRIYPLAGVAVQIDQSTLVPYDDAYFAKYQGYEGLPIAERLNRFRGTFAKTNEVEAVLDIGVGSLQFLRAAVPPQVSKFGYDINPIAIAELQAQGWWLDLESLQQVPIKVGVVTLWDTFEHLPDPAWLLAKIRPGQRLCLSLPIFPDLTKIRESRHYRPNEHLTYWTDGGLRTYFARAGFTLEASSTEETKCGRDSIGSYRYRKGTIDRDGTKPRRRFTHGEALQTIKRLRGE